MTFYHDQKTVQKVKLVLVGDMGVGKTCLAVRFARNSFSEIYRLTVGASFIAKAVDTPDKTIVFQIWDTAGQERFHSLIPMYLRDAKAAIVVYDITDEDSFKSIKNIWLSKLRRDGPDNMKMFIVGSKSDLTEERKVERATGEEFAELHRCRFTETSAKTGDHVNELFRDIANCVSNVEDESQSWKMSSNIHLGDQPRDDDVIKRSRKCCK